jgi:hypothetical protein
LSGLGSATATKWEVAGSTGVTEAHRLTPGWIALCALSGLDPATATKWEAADHAGLGYGMMSLTITATPTTAAKAEIGHKKSVLVLSRVALT